MRENLRKVIRTNNGITLIALVITIIVLLILAGVSLNMIFDSNGLFKKASGTAEKYNEAKARETLETVLMGHAQTEKYTNPIYNQDDFLDNLILTTIKDSKVQGDIAIVDGYAYELDRTVPKIGKYLGKEEDLVFPEVSISTPVLATDYKTSTFTITAKEETNGISKIEVLQMGQVVQTFEYSNITETINQPCTVKRNGTYTVKAYSNLTGTARTEVTGIIMSVEFNPKGDETYKKEHSTTITVKETGERIKSLKYQWTTSVTEPAENTFIEECTNNSTITGKGEDMTGTYFLWVLLETETGKKNICGSEAFNFDNEGPEILTDEGEKISLNGLKVSYSISDNYSNLKRIDIYVDGTLESSITDCKDKKLFQGEYSNISLTTGEHLIKFEVYDELDNKNEISKKFSTKLYAWESYNYETIRVIDTPSSFYNIQTDINNTPSKTTDSEHPAGIYLFTEFPSWRYEVTGNGLVSCNGVYHDSCTWQELYDIMAQRNLQIRNIRK